jgi:hypothetical protein
MQKSILSNVTVVWNRILASIPWLIVSLFVSGIGLIDVDFKNSAVVQPTVWVDSFGEHLMLPNMNTASAYQNHLFSTWGSLVLVEVLVIVLFVILDLSSALFPKTVGKLIGVTDTYYLIPFYIGSIIGVGSLVYFQLFS